MNTIIPSIGRIVHVETDEGVQAAIVTKVHSQDVIDVTVFAPNGGSPWTLVSLQYGEAQETDVGNTCWHWMEYQVQQAAKHAE